MTASFSHLDPGTSETVWRDEPRLLSCPPLALDAEELVVVAAHPDDETLGAAGLIRRMHRDGRRVTVVVATDGEGSHPQSPTHSAGMLARRRRAEVALAVESLAPGAAVHFLGLPDGGLRENGDRLETELGGILDRLLLPGGTERVAVAAPWSGDRHRDHRVIAEAVALVCGRRGIPHVAYPIWLWHWGTPADVPWESMRALGLTGDELEAKQRAIAQHVSQISALSPDPRDAAVLAAGMLSHFGRSDELYVVDAAPGSAPSMGAQWFEDFYGRHEDPWGFETRWYEKRKRAVLMAALPSERLGDVLEIGCATGLLTRDLAVRADSVVALDPVPSALRAARTRMGDVASVTFRVGQVPGDWPRGSYDTVVLSEVGYYLSVPDLARTIRLIEESLAPDGCLVACHWRHPVAAYPQTGDEVHDALRASPRWESTVRHEERDFLLEVFSRVPARSVAQREGLA